MYEDEEEIDDMSKIYTYKVVLRNKRIHNIEIIIYYTKEDISKNNIELVGGSDYFWRKFLREHNIDTKNWYVERIEEI